MESADVAATAADTGDPRAGLRAVASLRVLADVLELRQVEAALRAGMSWQEVADALGVTRQAAHKKHAKRVDPAILRAPRTTGTVNTGQQPTRQPTRHPTRQPEQLGRGPLE